MARRVTQKQLKHDEFVDAAFDFGHWIEENWTTVARWVGMAIIAALAVVGWWGWSAHTQNKTRQALASAVTLYDQAEAQGFDDTTDTAGLLETFREIGSGGSTASRTARFYQGTTLFHLGRMDEAATALAALADSGATDTLGATAQLMLARVRIAQGKPDEAVAMLQSLAEETDAPVPADRTLLVLGRIELEIGRDEDARATFQRIVDDYPLSASVAEARELLQ